MGHCLTASIQSVKRSAVVAVTIGLALLVSGFLPVLIQGYAWIDMANKAGGIQKIGEVVTEAEPCEICRAAQELRENSREDGEIPVPVERIEILKSITLDSISGLNAPVFRLETELRWNLALNSDRPASCEFAPGTPPPRVLEA